MVEVKLSVNLTSLTIEQVIGKRKKLLQDMVPGLEAELKEGPRRRSDGGGGRHWLDAVGH